MQNKNINRRTALKALGLVTAGTAASLGATAANAAELFNPLAQTNPNSSGLYPFEGVRQPGILTETPEHVLVAVLDVLVASPAELVSLFKTITERLRLLSGGWMESVGEEAPDLPPQETGELGFSRLQSGHLGITVGLGASLFMHEGKDRFGLAAKKPMALKPMPTDFVGDKLDPARLGGDIFLQISSDHPLYNLHALRSVLRATRGQLSPRWLQQGFQRFFEAAPGEAKARGLLGFKDGTANLDTNDNALMSKLVWTGAEEPAWAQGGTYVVTRVIHEQLERWDRLTLAQQEASMGRRKRDGAALGENAELVKPDYNKDPNGDQNPLNSHIRKANPRLGEESEKRRFLRRGYLYFNGLEETGVFDAGFLFMAFCRNVEEQFEFVKRNYMTNHNFPKTQTGVQELDEYLFCIGGGYFYVPPGLKGADRFLADALLLG